MASADLAGRAPPRRRPKLLFLVTEDWYFCSHRLGLARAAEGAGFEVLVAARVDRHGAAIEAAGLGLRPLGWRRGERGPRAQARALADIVALYRRERPDLVHHVALKPILYGSLAARLAGTGPVVNAIAGLGYFFTSPRLAARWGRPLVELALARALRGSHVVVQNPEDEAAVRRLGVAPGRVHRIRGAGVDERAFRPHPPPAAGPAVALMVSRLLRDKGVGELAAAARLLRERGVAVTIRLAGGPDPANPASVDPGVVEGWQAAGLLEWLGPVEDVAGLWAGAHIGVLPSYREGLPKSLLEGAACGRPLVATDVPGCREVVREGVNGRLVPPRDPAALAAAIAELAGDPALRDRMGLRSRAIVEAEFTEARVIEQTLALYRALVAGPRDERAADR